MTVPVYRQLYILLNPKSIFTKVLLITIQGHSIITVSFHFITPLGKTPGAPYRVFRFFCPQLFVRSLARYNIINLVTELAIKLMY